MPSHVIGGESLLESTDAVRSHDTSHFKPPITGDDYPHKGECGGSVFDMELLNWLIEATNVTGLAVYSAGMTLIMGALALANQLDRRQEIRQLQ
jgi:hypothetical protein